jgi:hypothetical protein
MTDITDPVTTTSLVDLITRQVVAKTGKPIESPESQELLKKIYLTMTRAILRQVIANYISVRTDPNTQILWRRIK